MVTLGGAAIVLNGGLVAIAAAISPGATISGWFAGVVVAVGLTVITTAASALLAIDDDETWQRNVVRRQARRAGAISSDVPGVVFLEIDGLAHEVLRRAVRDGNAPSWRAGCATTRIASSAGRPTGRRRPAPARPACCTATTTTCPPSAGGRRIAGARS